MEVVVDAFLQDGEDEFVAADGAKERFLLDAGDEVGAAGDDAGLRAAEEFIAREDDEVDAVLEGFLWSRFVIEGGEFVGVHDGAGAEVFDEGEIVLVRKGGEIEDGGFVGETFDVEVRAVHL